MMRKPKNRTEQQKNGELGLIIDEFGRAMWHANRAFVARQLSPANPDFTLNMGMAWTKYVLFCRENPE